MTEAAHQEFSVGDLVWYLIEFENYNLLVRCRITRKDDQFQKKDPAGILFYDIDEPLGHSADPDELGLNLEEWKEILSKEYDAEAAFICSSILARCLIKAINLSLTKSLVLAR